MGNGNILNIMSQKYNHLTKSEKKVADYIFGNRISAQYMSITNLAEACGVAESTIFRFCRSLGAEGYNDFKISLAKDSTASSGAVDYELYGKVLPNDSIPDMCKKLYNSDVEAISQTLELLDEVRIAQAGRILSAAEKVYCFGQGGSLIIAMEAWGRFVTSSSKFFTVEDSHMQAMAASLLTDKDAILFFSYSGATRDMMDVLRPAKERGVKIILVTHFEKSPGTTYADVILLCGSNEGPLQAGSIAAKMALMFVIDVLYNEYCRLNLDECIKNHETTAEAISNKML